MRLLLAITCAMAFVVATMFPARAEFVTVPFRQAPGSPIVVTQTSVILDPNNSGTFRACLSFKNIATKTANAVEFTFRFDDLLGNPIAESILQRTGSFAPNIPIEGKMSDLGGNSDSFNNCVNLRMTSIKPNAEIVGVNSVRFDDGTSWKKGDPLPGASPAAAPAGGNVSVSLNGATASGGSLASGGTFGAIAWVPGSRKIFASAADEQSQTDADYAALSKCNTVNGGGTACKILVEMSGSTNKCGALALDESAGKFASAKGPTTSDTIRAAQDALVKAGGTLTTDSVVTVVCNTK